MSVVRELGWGVTDGRQTERASNTVNGLVVVDLGRVPYAPAYELQQAHHTEVLGWREVDGDGEDRPLGRDIEMLAATMARYAPPKLRV